MVANFAATGTGGFSRSVGGTTVVGVGVGGVVGRVGVVGLTSGVGTGLVWRLSRLETRTKLEIVDRTTKRRMMAETIIFVVFFQPDQKNMRIKPTGQKKSRAKMVTKFLVVEPEEAGCTIGWVIGVSSGMGAVKGLPQPEQNLASGRFSDLQPGQVMV